MKYARIYRAIVHCSIHRPMKKRIPILSFICCIAMAAFAQQTTQPKMPVKSLLTADLFGQGALVSVNYDGILYEASKSYLSGRIGVGLPNSGISLGFFGEESGVEGVAFPHAISWTFGKRHGLEIGAGGIVNIVEKVTTYSAYPLIGYRYQPQVWHNTKISFRFYVHPVHAAGVVPVGLSVGIGLPGGKNQ